MKKWINIFLCVVLSAAVWLILNLGREYSGLVSVPVLAQSEIDGRARTASAEVMITARIQAPGYRHVALSRRRSAREVDIDASDLHHAGGDFYSINENSLFKYASAIFGENVNLESFVADDVRFKFLPENFAKLPVIPVVDLSFRGQYMALDEMSFQPDSVLVYAEPARLEEIDRILTRPISLRDLHASVHGAAKLDIPAGARLSQNEVAYSLEVTRFVEFRRVLPIEIRGARGRRSISALPSESTVTFRCIFPMTSDPSEKVSLYVDYSEFAESLDGTCLVHVDGLPESVINCVLDPEVCVCVEVER